MENEKDNIFMVEEPIEAYKIDNYTYEEAEEIFGAPTLIVEILSTNVTHDRIRKYNLYEKYGVKEYWIVDPVTRITDIFILNKEDKYELEKQYKFDENIKSYIFEDLEVSLKDIYNTNYVKTIDHFK